MNRMNHDERTRVIFNLPVGNEGEFRAVNHVISFLQEQRTQPIGVGGFTHSLIRNAVFQGYWWSSNLQRWIKDKILLFIVDYHFSPHDPILTDHLRELKNVINDAYRRYGSIQEEIWMVASPVRRYINS